VTHSIIPSASSSVQILATVPLDILPPLPTKTAAQEGDHVGFGPDACVVAVSQGRLMATSFHPELTTDARFHELFIKRCLIAKAEDGQ
jgi:5'-phosphate synthase pdxT subunit